MDQKKCSGCHQYLPICSFHKSTKGTYGVGAYCKGCQRARNKEWQKKRKEDPPQTQKIVKKCSTCGRHLPADHFYRNTYGSNGLQSCCKECQRGKAKNWRSHNKERVKATSKAHYEANKTRSRNKTLLRDTGFGIETYNTLYSEQGGRCAICGKAQAKSLDMDHDHKSGKVRGLLCNNCNRGLGLFKDSPEVLRNAAKYLELAFLPREPPQVEPDPQSAEEVGPTSHTKGSTSSTTPSSEAASILL